jgi:hypothetical protein
MMTPNILFVEVKNGLVQLIDILNQLTYDDYTQPIKILSDSTIGEHTRHIIEVFQKTISEYEAGVVDYDKRERNVMIQTNTDYAIECLAEIVSRVEKEDKVLTVLSETNHRELPIQTSYFREILYNIDHCVHHKAIIKIGILVLGNLEVDDQFGVAISTLNYRNKCAQ